MNTINEVQAYLGEGYDAKITRYDNTQYRFTLIKYITKNEFPIRIINGFAFSEEVCVAALAAVARMIKEE